MTTNKHVRKSNATVKKRRNSLLYENLVYSGSSNVQTNIQNVCYDKNSIKVSHFENTKDLIASFENTKVNWIHISGLNNVEIIGELCQAFGLQIPAIQDILNAKHIAKIEDTNGVLLAILDRYAYDESQNLNSEHLGFVLGSHFVISFEETQSTHFESVVKALESQTGQVRDQKSDYLFNLLINIVVDSYLEVLEFHQNGLMEMEDMLMEFNADHKESGQSIQHFRKDYSKLKKSIAPLREQFGHLILMESDLIGKSTRIYYRDTYDHLQQVTLMLDANRETIASLMDLYLANNDLRMNLIMKQFTVISTVFIPLTFLVGVWGMNFKFMPELEWVNGYLYSWIIMVVIGAALYYWFRKKHLF